MRRWLLALAFLVPAAPAAALEGSVYFLSNHTYNETWAGFQDGPATASAGIRFSHEFIERWHGRLSYDSASGKDANWDPTGHLEEYENRFDYGWPFGKIESRRRVGWTALSLRYDLLVFAPEKSDVLWRLYLTAGPAVVRTQLRLSDDFANLEDEGSYFGCLVGGGAELIILGPAEKEKRLSIFLELQRREFRPHYNVGTGFHARTDISAAFIAGLGWYFF